MDSDARALLRRPRQPPRSGGGARRPRRARASTRVYCLGDLVGYGADPNGVIDLLRAAASRASSATTTKASAGRRATAAASTPTRGAHRRGLVCLHRRRRSPPRARPICAPCRANCTWNSPARRSTWCTAVPGASTSTCCATVTNGPTCGWPRRRPTTSSAFGHTHDPWFRGMGSKLFVNVGSVGRPKDGDPRATYVVLSSVSPGRPLK